jgi:hypothetical protein
MSAGSPPYAVVTGPECKCPGYSLRNTISQSPLCSAVHHCSHWRSLPCASLACHCHPSDQARPSSDPFPYAPPMIPSIGNATPMSGKLIAVPRPSNSQFCNTNNYFDQGRPQGAQTVVRLLAVAARHGVGSRLARYHRDSRDWITMAARRPTIRSMRLSGSGNRFPKGRHTSRFRPKAFDLP